MKNQEKVQIKLIRSLNGRDARVIRTVKALGLERIGDKRDVTLTPALAGMVNKVGYLLDVQSAK